MDVALIAALTLVASAVDTMTGFGTSTIMVPVLASFLPLPQVLLLVGIIHRFGDIWKMALFRSGVRWRLIGLFGLPPPPSLPAPAGREDHVMTTLNTGIGAITLRTMRAKLDEAADIAPAAEALAADGQPDPALVMALDVEPLASELTSYCRLSI